MNDLFGGPCIAHAIQKHLKQLPQPSGVSTPLKEINYTLSVAPSKVTYTFNFSPVSPFWQRWGTNATDCYNGVQVLFIPEKVRHNFSSSNVPS